MVRGEVGGPPERAAVRVDQRLPEPGRERGLVEAEPAEEVPEPGRRGHLAVIDRAQALGLAPALEPGLVAGLEADGWRVVTEQRVKQPRRGAHAPAADLDLGHPLAVEPDERVEEVEQDGRVAHQRGLRAA